MSKKSKHRHKRDKDSKQSRKRDRKREEERLQGRDEPPSPSSSSSSSSFSSSPISSSSSIIPVVESLRVLLFHHPNMVEEVLLVLRALEDGEWLKGEEREWRFLLVPGTFSPRPCSLPLSRLRTGQGVALDGLPSADMRRRLGALLEVRRVGGREGGREGGKE